ncbi:hypothetical protein [Streptomyces virginiae]|uniref:hypothetical protein n=1 Tax=Streptomyces virginiae TaxID=1961 RepID=UPI002DDBA473|nr:hypothetical protein [Streptomyces virginiae]WSC75568.1 hypothetical protein OHA56_04180 [Streptomyces virginiae]
MVPAFIGAAHRLAFVAARSTGAVLALALTAAVHARPALGRQAPAAWDDAAPRRRRFR